MARILKTCEVEETNFHNSFLEFDLSKDIKVGSNPCQPSLPLVFLNTYKWGFHGCEHSSHGILERSSIWLGEGDENNLDNNGNIVYHVVFAKSVGTTTNAKNIPSQEKFTSNVFDGRSLWNIKRMSNKIEIEIIVIVWQVKRRMNK